MKKPFLLIFGFLTLAAVAVVYAIMPAPDASPVKRARIIPAPHGGGASANSAVTFEWKLANPYLLSGGPTDAFLDLRVTGQSATDSRRRPMNVVMVIDRSGSMGSENKLENVKSSAAAIINNMTSEDRLSVVIYDDSVQTILPSTPVTNKELIREMVYGLVPGGGTNLFGGLQQGFAEARENFRQGSVNRILLLSDGLANVGISDPARIADEARRIRQNAISISTLGVGLEYNENLMANIADASGGNYYYVSRDSNMAEVFRREWNLMQSVVATNATASLELHDGVEALDVAGFEWKQDGRKLIVQVPDIYSSETKRILVQLRVTPGDEKSIVLGNGTFRYTDMSGEQHRIAQLSFTPKVNVVSDAAIVKRSFDRDVQAKVASVQASKKMDEAYSKLEEGDVASSYDIARQANEELRALGYIQNREQAARYEDALNFLSRGKAAAPAPSEAKDFLKKQKEQERKNKQSIPQ